MKIYISGQITGLEYLKAKTSFKKAEDLLRSKGFDVINPTNNGLSRDHSWNEHMVRDIELLLTADAIFMLKGWVKSSGARIEHFIATELEKQSIMRTNNLFVTLRNTYLSI